MDTLITVTLLGGILLNFAQSTISDNTRNLQYYSGALTTITCSTTTPRFLINGIYTPQSYHLLPELLGIEAVVAPDRSNVTLHVNGSTMAHNATVDCQNIIDPVTGGAESMFQLTLLFAERIPAPHNIRYNANDGVLHWSPPRTEKMPDNGNVNVALRITHYIIYVTDQQTGLLMTNITTTGPDTNISMLDAMTLSDLPCSMSVRVSAVNPAGEGQRSTSITKNSCSPDSVTLPEHSTVTEEMDTENHNSLESVALSAGGIAAVAIGLVLVFIVVCLALLTAVLVFTRKRRSRAIKSTKSNEDPEWKVQLGSSSEVSDTSESSQTKLLTPSNSPMVTPKQLAIHEDPEQKVQLGSSSEVSDTSESSQTKLLTRSNSPMATPKQPAIAQNNEDMTNKSNTYDETQQQQCTHYVQDNKLIYAELCTPVVNTISQPSSIEDTAYAVINHTDRTN